jgi:hypothetical protein
MLLALAKKLRNAVTTTSADGPTGTLTSFTPYSQLKYGEIDGVGTVTIDALGNMAGFSPVLQCKDRHGEVAWIPTELIRNLRLEPFLVTEKGTKIKTAT